MNETEQPALARHTVREAGTQHGQIMQNWPVSVPWEGAGAGNREGLRPGSGDVPSFPSSQLCAPEVRQGCPASPWEQRGLVASWVLAL